MAIRNEAAQETITVKLGTVGGVMKEVLLNGDRSVAAALRAAGFPEDAEVRVNGQNYSGDDQLENGDVATVLAAERVKGGSR